MPGSLDDFGGIRSRSPRAFARNAKLGQVGLAFVAPQVFVHAFARRNPGRTLCGQSISRERAFWRRTREVSVVVTTCPHCREAVPWPLS